MFVNENLSAQNVCYRKTFLQKMFIIEKHFYRRCLLSKTFLFIINFNIIKNYILNIYKLSFLFENFPIQNVCYRKTFLYKMSVIEKHFYTKCLLSKNIFIQNLCYRKTFLQKMFVIEKHFCRKWLLSKNISIENGCYRKTFLQKMFAIENY